MKILKIFIALCACSSFAAQSTSPPMGIRDKTPRVYAFTNAKLVVNPDYAIVYGVLVIRDGYIVAVGKSVQIPEDAVVIDLDGKSIFPAFIDPFTEYGLSSDKKDGKSSSNRGRRPVYTVKQTGAQSWNDALHPEVEWVSKFEPDDDAAKEFLKLGYAAVQSGKHNGVLRGKSFVALLGKGVANDQVIKGASNDFASFNKGNSKQQYPSSLMGSIALLRQTFLDAQWYLEAQAAYTRNRQQEMPEFNRAIASLGDPQSIRFVFELSGYLDMFRLDKLAKEFNLDVVAVGNNYEYQRLSDLAATGRSLILPVDYPESPLVGSIEDELDVSLATLRHWERAPSNPAALEDAGITFAFTTNGLKKRSDFMKNVRKAVKRGLSQKTVLAALTTIPAQLCGVADQVGKLQTGMLANFFITDGNPFEEQVTLFSTWVAGEKHEFVSLERTDFRGEYQMNLFATDLTLSIKGEIDSYKGSIDKDSVSVKLKEIKSDGSHLTFQATLDTLGIKGVTRFSARLENDTLKGEVDNINLGRRSWIASVFSEFKSNEKSDTTESEEFSLVSKLTYPNRGFGFESVPPSEDILVRNATIWTSADAGILSNSDILIRDGKIAAIGKEIKAAKNVTVIDGTGKHITPGLIDEHSHIAISRGVNEGSHSITSEVRIGDVINSDDINIYRAIAGGTSMVQCLHGSANPIGGQAQIIKLRWGMSPDEMKFEKAPLSIKFALGENVKQSNWGDNFNVRYPQSRMGVETIMKDGFNAALENEKAWGNYNKLGRAKRSTIPPRRDLQLEALQDILHSRMFVHCHSYHQTEILMLMRLAEEYGFRIQTFTHILEGYKVADEMAAHGASASSFADWWAYKFEVYDAIPYNTCIMSKRGVVTSVNSDSPELGRRLNQEAAKSALYCGMEAEEALKLVTINPAKQLRIDEYVGSLEVGKDADFVIWGSEPISVYAKPEMTFIDGRRFFDIERDKETQKINLQERNDLIAKVLSEGKSKGKKSNRKKAETDTIWHCDDIFDAWQVQNARGDQNEVR